MRQCSVVIKTQKDLVIGCLCSYFVHSEADGVHVLTLAPISAAVLLHEGHQETARHLVILGVVVFLQQRDLKLRVDPKRVCTESQQPASGRAAARVSACTRAR